MGTRRQSEVRPAGVGLFDAVESVAPSDSEGGVAKVVEGSDRSHEAQAYVSWAALDRLIAEHYAAVCPPAQRERWLKRIK